MKRALLTFALIGFACVAANAQQDNHHGPVVYPGNSTPGSPQNESPAAANNSPPETMAPDTNLDLATPTPGTAPSSVPPDTSSVSPAPGVSVTPQITTPSANTPGSILSPNAAASAAPGLVAATQGKQDDIYDIRHPYFYLRSWFWVWVTLALIALAAALIAGTWYVIPKLRAHRIKTAYELALERLEKARAMLNDPNPEPYAVFVSETIRAYLGQRFRLPTTRRTTEEFLREMSGNGSTPLAPHRDLLREFLEACDLVKFAHYEPGRDELEKVQQRALSFVTATRPVEGMPA